jgi:hypothetical protein
MLFESSCGYVLFRAHDVYKVERTYVDTEKYIESFDKNFELVACHAFASSNEALMYLTADGNGMFSDQSFESVAFYSVYLNIYKY